MAIRPFRAGRPGSATARSSWPASTGSSSSNGVDLGALGAIVVGTGPGAFTGLRVGLATAKGLAHALAIPIVGIATSTALLLGRAWRGAWRPSGGERTSLLLPAGPRDRVLVDAQGPRLLPAGSESGSAARERAGRGRSRRAGAGGGPGSGPRPPLTGSAPALLALGAGRLAAGDADDLARLVPEYVSLPRGVSRLAGAIEWSRDPR